MSKLGSGVISITLQFKDHMRDAGDICYADVYRDGTGVVEYTNYEDMKYALRKLDDTKFKSHEVKYCLKYAKLDYELGVLAAVVLKSSR